MNTRSREGVAAIGMFDGVHLGHRFLIGKLAEEAHSRGKRAVAVTFSHHPLALIAPERAPLILTSSEEKERLLHEAGADDVVMLDFNPSLRQLTAEEFMRHLHSSHSISGLMIGYDHRFGSDLPPIEDYKEIGRKAGIDVICAPPRDNGSSQISSSLIRRQLTHGDVKGASEALGRPYTIEGTVEHGRQLGRTIGFPTANIHPDSSRLIPATGVYGAIASLPTGERFPAMVNIGQRPTVDVPNAPQTIEANLLGFSGDLYGTNVSLSFVNRIRDEQKFSSLAELQHQLDKDRTSLLNHITNLQ